MNERVLILDFGAQYTQLIARRVRENGVYCEILPCTVDDDDDPRLRASGDHPLGRPGVHHRGGSATRAGRGVRARPADPRHLLRRADDLRAARRQGRDRPSPRVRPRLHRRGGPLPAVRGAARARRPHPGLDEPRRQGGRAAAGLSRGRDLARARRSPRSPTTSAGSTACSSTPRWCTRPRAARCSGTSPIAVAGCRGEWSMARFRESALGRIREQVGAARVICGLSGGVDSAVTALLLHEAIGEQLTCVFVDTGLLRAGEPEQIVELFRGHFNIPLVVADAEDALSRAPGRRHRSRAEAQDHRHHLHRRLRSRGQSSGRGRFSRPGHALSGRHRIGLVQGAERHHQVAPQCRRAARAHAASA